MENKKIICIGDCLTNGRGEGRELSYASFLEKKYNVEKVGRSMIKVSHLSEYKELFTKAIHSGIDNVVILWCGTNDFFLGVDESLVEKDFSKFCDFVKCLYARLFVITILPRTEDPTLPCAGFEEKRILFNEFLRKTYADEVIDLASHKNLKEINGEFYEEDSTHLTEKGCELVAKEVIKKVKQTLNIVDP